MSRIEDILQSMIDDTPYTDQPQSRVEELLLAIKNDTAYTGQPQCRIEALLLAIRNDAAYTEETYSRIEEILLSKITGDEYTKTTQSRIEALLVEWDAGAEKELEGVPPLTYKAKSGELTNYRIYGNTVSGEGVGDLVETGDHAGEYLVPVTVTNGTDTQTIGIYLPEQIRTVGDDNEYVDYQEQKQHRVRKNLLKNTAASKTIQGVTFIVNDDGSVTCDGTATNNIWFSVSETMTFHPGLILNGFPAEAAEIGVLRLTSSDGKRNLIDRGHGVLINEEIYGFVNIRLNNGAMYDSLTVYPMVRLASVADDTYEPYIENTEPDVTLPVLPALDGTNAISIGTAVPPSKVTVTGKIKENQ